MARIHSIEAPIVALPDAATKLALDRTRLAHDRTMLAWVRTATSLITFGFSVYKFFAIEMHSSRAGGLIGPRGFGLMMISIGLISLLLATVQHRREMNELRAMSLDVPSSQAAALAGLIAILGILAFLVVVLRA